MATPNTKLRATREATPSRAKPGERMGRAELANAVNAYLWDTRQKSYNLDAHTLARYESGKIVWPGEAYREGLRAVLGAATDADLGFRPTRRGNTSMEPVSVGMPVVTPEIIDNPKELLEPIGGRFDNFVDSHGPSLRIVHVIANPLEWDMWDQTKRRNFLVQAAGTVTTILGILGRSLDNSPARAGASYSKAIGLDTETLEGLEQTTLGLRRAYRSTGALSLLGPSHGTLNLLTAVVPRSGKYQDRVVTAIGQTAALIGVMLSLDLGDFEAGKRYLAVAARAAQQARNNDLLAFTLGAQAFQSAYGGDPVTGRDYADSALNVAGRGVSPVTHGWLSAVASEMHATDNNARDR